MKENTIAIGGRKRVLPGQIVYLKSEENYTRIYMSDLQVHFVATTLKKIEARLLAFPGFKRINRGTVVNESFIECIEENYLLLSNHMQLNISRRKRHLFNQNSDKIL